MMEDGIGLHQGEIPTQPMRVKILYSFDTDNKTNCLSRLPSVFQIPTVTIDEKLKIGVIELRTCLQAVTTASPEILSNLSETDFIVYAFDFSEHDTPLVGQGMLSAALAYMSVGGTEESMITGRICKNGPSLFNNGIAETLEVKLRLVPMRSNVSKSTFLSFDQEATGGFDPNSWSVAVEQSKMQVGSSSSGSVNIQGRTSFATDNAMELDLGSTYCSDSNNTRYESSISRDSTTKFLHANSAAGSCGGSTPGSRAGSPLISHFSDNASAQMAFIDTRLLEDGSQQPRLSRPGSRANASVSNGGARHSRQDSHPTLSRSQSEQSGIVFFHEDGRPRKRAKVTRSAWKGRGAFGTRSSDLRVTASTAASMHMHRPIPRHPSVSATELDPPPRVPTPVPQRAASLPQQADKQIPRARSLLRQASTADSDLMSEYDSHFSDAVMSSPEENSPGINGTADGTPCEIPSSPPVFTDVYMPPSSPGLPTLSRSHPIDSGYMSERGMSSSNLPGDFETGSYDIQKADRRSDHLREKSTVPFIKNENNMTESSACLSTASTPAPEFTRLDSTSGSRSQPLNSHRARQTFALDGIQNGMKAPTRSQQSFEPRQSSLALPPAPMQDNTASQSNSNKRAKAKSSMERHALVSRTSYEPDSFSPAQSDNEGSVLHGTKRSGSGAARRKTIKERLEKSIANGDMPQFCHHCGAIETPTWRKLYVKFVDGRPSPLDSAEGEGETIGVENLETDDDGNVSRFVIRKSMKKTKDSTPGPGFEDISVCNPCGLWFGKFRSMRPADKWHKKSAVRKSKKRSAGEDAFMAGDDMDPHSELSFCVTDKDKTDFVGNESFSGLRNIGQHSQNDVFISKDVTRAMSVQPLRTELRQPRHTKPSMMNRMSGREVQSSPVRRCGSQDSPIDIDDASPKPTRRLLFPSPRREGEVKLLNDGKSQPQSAAKSAQIEQNVDVTGNSANNTLDIFLAHKENMDPMLSVEDDAFAGLFDDSPTAKFKTPTKSGSKKTTPRSSRITDHLLKTPTPSNRKGKPATPRIPQSNSSEDFADGVMSELLTSPSASRYFLRSTPSRKERTPRQPMSRNRNRTTEISPFSRHLAQMLSDASEPVAFTSPARAFDFADLPTFNTPGRNIDWAGIDEMLSSEFPILDDVTNHAF